MKKEIGGYFELEEMAGEEYYPDLYKVNLGRTALLWLLESHQYKKIYIFRYFFASQSLISAEIMILKWNSTILMRI